MKVLVTRHRHVLCGMNRGQGQGQHELHVDLDLCLDLDSFRIHDALGHTVGLPGYLIGRLTKKNV